MILPWQDCPFQCTQSQEFHIKSFPECAVGWCAQYGQTDMILRVPSSDYIEEPRLTICLKYREIIQALVSDTYRRGYHLRVLYQGGRDLWIMFLLNKAIVQRRVLWSSTLYKRVCVVACHLSALFSDHETFFEWVEETTVVFDIKQVMADDFVIKYKNLFSNIKSIIVSKALSHMPRKGLTHSFCCVGIFSQGLKKLWFQQHNKKKYYSITKASVDTWRARQI